MSGASGLRRLGAYDVLGPLGSGGMGEVYRARDRRLGRDVALKVLPAELASDPERLRRFEHEARAASALNHPNIVTIYEVGREVSTPFIAMELIEGRTLREMVRAGPLPLKRALEIAVGVAEGLASAHAAGIAHRDVKPENVMVSKDGVVKILDFGLAKRAFSPGASGKGSTESFVTAAGSVVGTVRYMSPEQAAGRPVDFRSDQFSFGSVVYEMASGRPAFSGATNVDTLSAILHEDPEPLGRISPSVPVPLRWIVERCLAKEAGDRYASTHDLARDLRAVREHLSEISTGSAPVVAASWRRATRLPLAAAAAALVALGVTGGIFVGSRRAVGPPSFRQLTFRIGEVAAARFAPDGQTIVYGAGWRGSAADLFVHRLGTFESRPLGVPEVGLGLLAVSTTGELLVYHNGSIARMGLASAGGPRDVVEGSPTADWSPNGTEIAIGRTVDGRGRLEYPVGHVLYQETAGYLGHLRVSRDGRRVAFLDHPVRSDMGGRIMVADRGGTSRALTGWFNLAWGLAWSPDGREVWFTASPAGGNAVLYAVDLSGRQRLVARTMGSMQIMDVSPSGRALMTGRRFREHVMALAPGETRERELTWLDLSLSRALSRDGTMVLMLESGEGGGEGNSVFVRRTDGSPAVRLGEGDPWALSPDGRFAAAFVKHSGQASLVLYPTGPGEARTYPLSGLEPQWADWLPDGNRILVVAGEPGRGARLYVQDVAGGAPKAVSPYGYRAFEATLSPDGRYVVAQRSDAGFVLLPLEGGEPVPVAGLTGADVPRGWSGDGRSVYVTAGDTVPRRVELVDVTTGSRRLWKELGSETGATGIHVTPDGRSYVYTYAQGQSDLYLVEGLK